MSQKIQYYMRLNNKVFWHYVTLQNITVYPYETDRYNRLLGFIHASVHNPTHKTPTIKKQVSNEPKS